MSFYDVKYDQSVWRLADLVCVGGVCGGVECLGGDLCFRCVGSEGKYRRLKRLLIRGDHIKKL